NAIQLDGQAYGTEVQYNLFFQINGPTKPGDATAPNLVRNNNNTGITNDQPVFGDPAFRDSKNGNLQLLSNSAAIDRARSELGPSIFGDMLYPAVTINPANLNAIPIRNVPGGPGGLPAGDVNEFGGNGAAPFAVDIVTLPGEPVTQRGFPDQWIPVLPTSGLGTGGTATTPGTYFYAPIAGERD